MNPKLGDQLGNVEIYILRLPMRKWLLICAIELWKEPGSDLSRASKISIPGIRS
jgi:hypothetical protein